MDATEETFLNQPSAFADGLRFPLRLHVLLEESDKRGQSSIVSWIHNGTAFKVHDRQAFIEQVMPTFLSTCTYKSYQRNLNLWGFETVSKGKDRGVCRHDTNASGEENPNCVPRCDASMPSRVPKSRSIHPDPKQQRHLRQ